MKKGDEVQHKSGGPRMIVVEANDRGVSCRWWNAKTSTYDIDQFDESELTPHSTSIGNGDPEAVAKLLVGKARMNT